MGSSFFSRLFPLIVKTIVKIAICIQMSLDTTAKTMTVKSRVAYQEAISELKHFKGGDRVWIVWSGIHDPNEAGRQVRRSETGRKIDENFMPAELVSTEAPAQYLTIRIKVLEGGLAAIKTVKPASGSR
jgi:hypothetical protein